nr:hypothetical protein [uncultured Flavobacterium sp.]
MKIILILLLFISGIVNAQETEFKITNEGYSKYVVEEIEGKKQDEIYSKVLDWALVTYKNPDRVITVKKENEYIRINASNIGDTYIIEVAVKDGKYKFTLITYEGHSGSISVSLMDVPNMLNKEGKVKWIYGGHKNNINFLNNLNKSLKDFILNNVEVSKQDW